jgi:N-acetyl-anhydromuramyl-L-alanine amidase AmpD
MMINDTSQTPSPHQTYPDVTWELPDRSWVDATITLERKNLTTAQDRTMRPMAAGIGMAVLLLLTLLLLAACAQPAPTHPSGMRCTSDGSAWHPTAPLPTTDPRSSLIPNTSALPECPSDLDCTFIPANHAPNKPRNPGPYDYGNYALANRPHDGLTITYIVLHNTEVDYTTTLSVYQDTRAQVSAHYTVNSDGAIVQSVPQRDVAWHAGNLYFNAHSIGIEHVGVAIEGGTHYTDEMYAASARLVQYLAAQHGIPLDRAHIFGHSEVPGRLPDQHAQMNWDPGVFWDWEHYMALLGAPLDATTAPANSTIVTLAPDFANNSPRLTYCYQREAFDCRAVPEQGANFVYLRTAPDSDAPLVENRYLGDAPTAANNWENKALAGQSFYRVAQQGEWDAIFFGEQQVWFHNPDGSTTVPDAGMLVTPKPDREHIPVYGHPYLEAEAYPPDVVPQEPVPIYEMPVGQVYVALEQVPAEYYATPPYTETRAAAAYPVITGETYYYRIAFNQRMGFVRAEDVDMLACGE